MHISSTGSVKKFQKQAFCNIFQDKKLYNKGNDHPKTNGLIRTETKHPLFSTLNETFAKQYNEGG